MSERKEGYTYEAVEAIAGVFFTLGASASTLSKSMNHDYWAGQKYIEALKKMYTNALRSEYERRENPNSVILESNKLGSIRTTIPEVSKDLFDAIVAILPEGDQPEAVHQKPFFIDQKKNARYIQKHNEEGAEEGVAEARKKPAMPVRVRKKI